MRRSDREVTDISEIRSILSRCKVLRIAMTDENGLYIVPMNFGWEMDGDLLTIYLHSAKEGRKVSAFMSGCSVAFETDCDTALKQGDIACKYGYLYSSIIGNGNISHVTDDNEKAHALECIMQSQTGSTFSFTKEQTDTVFVFKISADSYSCKARKA